MRVRITLFVGVNLLKILSHVVIPGLYPDDIFARPIESAHQLKLPRALVLEHMLPLMLIVLQKGHSDLGLSHINKRHEPRTIVTDLDVPGGEWLAEL